MEIKNKFTGCVMINFATQNNESISQYDLNSIINHFNDEEIIEEEKDFHVTLVYGIDRDSILLNRDIIFNNIKNYLKHNDLKYICVNNESSYFQNTNQSVIKFNIENKTQSYQYLSEIRNNLLSDYKHKLTYPNYIAHVTYLYLKPDIDISKSLIIDNYKNNNECIDLKINSITLSYKNDSDELIQFHDLIL